LLGQDLVFGERRRRPVMKAHETACAIPAAVALAVDLPAAEADRDAHVAREPRGDRRADGDDEEVGAARAVEDGGVVDVLHGAPWSVANIVDKEGWRR
jgi:hypothetical protein